MLKDQKGNALIQVAIMFPILLALTFGMINFILIVRDGTIMESAARSAARELGTSKSLSSALEKAKNDLRIGLVNGASVNIENSKIVVRKPVNINIPFMGKVDFSLKKESEFYTEKDSFYYGKPPELQKSPVDEYSGYTGNPYK
jgi:Flp pilus assembly protein TadG